MIPFYTNGIFHVPLLCFAKIFIVSREHTIQIIFRNHFKTTPGLRALIELPKVIRVVFKLKTGYIIGFIMVLLVRKETFRFQCYLESEIRL